MLTNIVTLIDKKPGHVIVRSGYVYYSIQHGEFCDATVGIPASEAGYSGVYRVPSKGGPEEVLWQDATCCSQIEHIAADATHLYFIDTGLKKVRRVPLAGGQPVTISSDSSGFGTGNVLVLDSTKVYWVGFGGLKSHAKEAFGEETVVLYAGAQTNFVRVDGDWLVWIDGIIDPVNIVKTQKNTPGSKTTVVSQGGAKYAMTTQSGRVFWIEKNGLGRSANIGGINSGLATWWSVQSPGDKAESLAVEGAHYAWTQHGVTGSRIRSLPPIQESVFPGLGGPHDVCFDEGGLDHTHLWWVDGNGIRRADRHVPVVGP